MIWLLVLLSPQLYGLDCNENGVEDNLDIDSLASEDCNQNGIPDECEFVPWRFSTRNEASPSPIASEAEVSIAADFNADGVTDIAVGHLPFTEGSIISILLGNKKADIFNPSVTYPAGLTLRYLTTVNLNGDVYPDLATANISEILILTNNGDGTFSDPVSFPSPRSTRFITAADLIGDPLDDLVSTSDRENTVSIFENLGDGTFATPITISTGDNPGFATTLDLDNNGTLDLVVANHDSNDISIIRNLGNGKFAPAENYSSIGRRPFAISPMDYEGDGDVDLLVGTFEGLSIFKNTGMGSFEPPLVEALFTSSLFIADFDRDGDDDITFVERAQNKISILRNLGDGQYSPPTGFVLDVIPLVINQGDFDGNGKLDLAATSRSPSQVSVYFNNESESLVMDSVILGAVEQPHAITGGDFDGDGLIDVATANGRRQTVSVFINNGDGTLQPEKIARAENANHLLSMISGDFDKDGDLDLAMSDSHISMVHLLFNDGSANFSGEANYPAGSGTNSVTTSDIDNDNDLDLITANPMDGGSLTVLFNGGDGTFFNQQEIIVERGPTAVAVADFDMDGDDDLAVSSINPFAVFILLNGGKGSFSEPLSFPISKPARFITTADFNRDDFPDLATTNNHTDEVLSGFTQSHQSVVVSLQKNRKLIGKYRFQELLMKWVQPDILKNCL